MGLRVQVMQNPLVQSLNSITDHLLVNVAMLNCHVPFDVAEPLNPSQPREGTSPKARCLGRCGACSWIPTFGLKPSAVCHKYLISIGKLMRLRATLFKSIYSRSGSSSASSCCISSQSSSEISISRATEPLCSPTIPATAI